jgi:hypothetical protein
MDMAMWILDRSLAWVLEAGGREFRYVIEGVGEIFFGGA